MLFFIRDLRTRGGRARERDIAKKELKKRLVAAARKRDAPLMSDKDKKDMEEHYAA